MPPEPMNVLKIIRMLTEGTKKGSIVWEAESSEGDVFRTNFPVGGVRLSRVVSFDQTITGPGPFILELLDPGGRTLSQFRPHPFENLEPIEQLFELAHAQALNLEKTLEALIEEIRNRAEKK